MPNKVNSKIKSRGMIVTVATLVAIMQGCAHAELDRRIDNEVAQEAEVKTQTNLRTESADLIRTALWLTDDQRQKLTQLKSKTAGELDPLWEQSLKLRAVLIKDVISTPYDGDEVALIEKRLRKIGDQRLTVMFDAVAEANQILGRDAVDNRKVVDDVLFEGHGDR
jgi:hypothetical protein